MDLNKYNVPLATTTVRNTDVDSHTNQIVLLFAKVLSYVFGSPVNLDARKWDDLNLEVEAWHSAIPSDFSPLWVEIPGPEMESAFPRVFMTQQVHSKSSSDQAKGTRLTADS